MRLPSPHLALVLIAAWCVAPSLAAAQMTLTYESPDEYRLPSVGYVSPPLGLVECELPGPVAFRLNGLDATGTFIDIWSGPGSTDCTPAAARNPLDGTCTALTVAADTMLSGNPVQIDLDIAMSELIDCAGDSAGSTIWFLLANTLGSTEEVTLSVSLPVTFDRTQPSPPTDISDPTSGDTMATISWTQAPETDIQRYDVYGDPGSLADSCDDAKAATSLVAGADFTSAGYVFLGQSTGSSTVINPADLGLETGKFATFVVISTDQALNSSVVSDVSCVSRIDTNGFCDSYGECEDCSAAGRVGLETSQMVSFPALTFLFAAGLGFARRRRK